MLASELYGIHIGSALRLDFFTGDRAWDFSGGSTLGYGLADSPAGLLAWILERWMKWSDNIAAHPRGGHFIPWEIPERWTADLVRTFKSRREFPSPPERF
jgi:hypothetical protein